MWHFSQSFASWLYLVWFLPVWLGIADECGGPAGASPCSASPLPPAIFAAHFIADAFRRRNLAREKNK